MNRNLATVAFTIAALGLVALFNVIPGASTSAGLVMLAIGGVLFLGQLLERSRWQLWRGLP
jgi:hypothetical protein